MQLNSDVLWSVCPVNAHRNRLRCTRCQPCPRIQVRGVLFPRRLFDCVFFPVDYSVPCATSPVHYDSYSYSQNYLSSRSPQDHESVERGDLPVSVHVTSSPSASMRISPVTFSGVGISIPRSRHAGAIIYNPGHHARRRVSACKQHREHARAENCSQNDMYSGCGGTPCHNNRL